MTDEYEHRSLNRNAAVEAASLSSQTILTSVSANRSITKAPAHSIKQQRPCPQQGPFRDEMALIQRILAGERDLFVELVRPYQKVVYSMAASIVQCDEDAEDVSQEALFKAFKNLAQFRGDSKFSTWIIQITLNEARHRVGKRIRSREESIESGLENEEGDYVPLDFADWREIPLEALQRKELRNALKQAISNLKPIYRDVLLLRDIQHLSVAETSDLLQISEAAVKTRLLRARLQVRDSLAPGFDGSWCSGDTSYRRVRPF